MFSYFSNYNDDLASFKDEIIKNKLIKCDDMANEQKDKINVLENKIKFIENDLVNSLNNKINELIEKNKSIKNELIKQNEIIEIIDNQLVKQKNITNKQNDNINKLDKKMNEFDKKINEFDKKMNELDKQQNIIGTNTLLSVENYNKVMYNNKSLEHKYLLFQINDFLDQEQNYIKEAIIEIKSKFKPMNLMANCELQNSGIMKYDLEKFDIKSDFNNVWYLDVYLKYFGEKCTLVQNENYFSCPENLFALFTLPRTKSSTYSFKWMRDTYGLTDLCVEIFGLQNLAKHLNKRHFKIFGVDKELYYNKLA